VPVEGVQRGRIGTEMAAWNFRAPVMPRK